MVKITDYNRAELSNWCSGCGNYAILMGIKKSLTELNLDPHNTALISGVGCYAKLPYWIKVNSFIGLHGRSLPVAQGVKLANPKLNVIAFSGDGAGYSEGGNHFIHACRRNVNLTYLVHNNSVFGLTIGQYSPTSEIGKKSKSSPSGSLDKPINPLTIAISAGATFVARAYAGNLKQMVEIIKEAINHKGFAFVDILQSCVTFGHKHNFYQERIYELGNEHNPQNKILSLEKAMEYELSDNEKIATGIFYQETE
jgi:2-oxoglutarate/2-oxoacid ferredoxin oxidoreductase subunit beta